MIRSVEVRDSSLACVSWWNSVPWLKDTARLEFEPGLNILFGPNGSGKSTVLTLMARALCCEQGDRQVVTRTAYYNLRKTLLDQQLLLGVIPVHDGSPTMHFSPEKRVGRIAGTLDDDFFMEGLSRSFDEKGSQGQITLTRIDKHMACLLSGSVPEIEWRITSEAPELREFLNGSFPRQRPTLLLDEPTRSLSIPYDFGFFEKLSEVALSTNVQIILATHSPAALFLDRAYYIETESGYVERCRRGLQSWMKRMESDK